MKIVIITTIGVMSLVGILQANDNIKEIVKKAERDGIVDEKIFSNENIVKENTIGDSKEVIIGEINEENFKREEKVAKFFNEKKIEQKKKEMRENKKIDNLNNETHKELAKDLGIENKSFIENEAQKIEKRVEVEPVKELKEKNIKKIEPLSKRIKDIKKTITFTVGEGSEEYFLFLNIDSEEGVKELKKVLKNDFKKNIKLNVVLMNNIMNVDERKKNVWILLGEDNKERIQRAKKIFVDNSSKYKWSLIYRNLFGIQDGLDDVVNQINNLDSIRKKMMLHENVMLFDSKLIKRKIDLIKS